MATYEYRCERCSSQFWVRMNMIEHDKGSVTCPDCNGPVVQQYSPFYAKTSKKS